MLAPIDVTNIRIETDRLILRPWRESDLSDFYEYASMEGVGVMAGWPRHESMETSKAVLGDFINGKKTLALELKENGKVIGSVGLEQLENLDESYDHLSGRELGYAMSKTYWGRGLMPEAAKAVVDYCFHTLGYDFLTCCHFEWNDQSRRVIEKTGFRFLKNIEYRTQMDTIQASRLYIQYNPNK